MASAIGVSRWAVRAPGVRVESTPACYPDVWSADCRRLMMTRNAFGFAIILAAVLTATGCTRPEATPKLLNSSANHATGSEQLTALLPEVTIDDDCACIVARSEGEMPSRHALVFPAGYSLGSASGSAAVLDDIGRVWAQLGERRAFGGGEIPAPADVERSTCRPLWRVAIPGPSRSRARVSPPPPPGNAR